MLFVRKMGKLLSTLRLWTGGSTMAEFTGNPDAVVEVHPNSHHPTLAWKSIQQQQVVQKIKLGDPESPIPEGHIRFVCLSDTHSRIENTSFYVPPGDVLIHAGDFTMIGLPQAIEAFNTYLGKLPHKVKVVIAGNHDLTFDQEMVRTDRDHLAMFGVEEDFEEFMAKKNITAVKELLTNCIYLEDASVSIHGIKIYGSPWQPTFGNWGFNLPRGQTILDKWNMIPADTDILVTHGPPIGHGDLCFDGQRVGCVDLLTTIQQRVRPIYHIFGHIHEGYGVTSDGNTTYINASTCTLRYKSNNQAIVFDYPIPDGHTREDTLDLAPVS